MFASSHYQSPQTYMYHDFRPQSYAPGTGHFANATAYTYATTTTPVYAQAAYSQTSNQRPTSAYYSSARPTTYYTQPPAYTYGTANGHSFKTTSYKRSSFTPASDRKPAHTDAKLPNRSSPSKKQRPQSHVQTHYTYKNVVSPESDDSEYDFSPRNTPPPPYNANTTSRQPSYNVRYSTHSSYEKDKSYREPSSTKKTVPQKEVPVQRQSVPQKQPTVQKQTPPPVTKTQTRPTSQAIPQRKPSTKEKKSTSAKPAAKPSAPKTATPKSSLPVKATAADAARAGIPSGYSYKNWDPTEEPIYLLGSVFDANSLGKWIYDWTVYTHRSATPIADLAGDLWLLLIQLAAKIKRADECMPHIRRRGDCELIDEFLESGDRLWSRLNKILHACEDYMWRAAKKEKGSKGSSVTMGPNSGCEFVQSIFGRDRRLEETEKLMTSMRLWSMRFDANCEDILRNP